MAAMGPWDEAHGRSGFRASVGRWHRRALPRRKALQGRGAEHLLQHVALQGTPKDCAPAWGRAGGAAGGRRCSALAGGVFPSGCLPTIFPCLLRLRALPCSLHCIPQDLLMCEPDPPPGERLRGWGSVEQPCNPPLHRERRPVGLLFFVS